MGKGLKVEVEWNNNSANDSKVTYVSSDETNNISQKNLSLVNNSKNPFLIGTSKFSDNCYFMNSFVGLISKKSSDSNLDINFNLSLKCEKVLSLLFKFDDILNIYPTQIKVDNKTYENNSNTFLLTFNSEVTKTIKIVFQKMNVANRPLTIKFVTPSLTRTYDTTQISNLKIGSSISSETGLSYGVVGKYGSFTITDKNHEIYSILKVSRFFNYQTKVYYDDKIIGTFKISDISASEVDYSYNVTLRDLTDEFDNYYVYPFFDYVKDNQSKFTAIDLMNKIKENSNSDFLKNCNVVYTSIEDYELPNSSVNNLKKKVSMIKTDVLYSTSKKSVKQILNEYCEFIQGNIIVSENGEDLEVVGFG